MEYFKLLDTIFKGHKTELNQFNKRIHNLLSRPDKTVFIFYNDVNSISEYLIT